ncbi:MAG: tyrosine--tRNA ligase [Clostridiales bacterium]|nr:tyrosine--tRNA ligase [Clostridiales bacterium]
MAAKKHVMDILHERGYLQQVTFEEELYKKLEQEPIVLYAGFDPTADSLHIGHYIPLMAMAHLQRAGHKPIVLIGGGTAMIGDPSGRTELRAMLTKEAIEYNMRKFKTQMQRVLDFEGENKAILANNADWLLKLNYIDFIRDIGAYFSVNKMLTAECYKNRMETGLTFLEFNYMPMQAYDFLVLNQKYNCSLQLGGNEQWSNMLAGADLIRRKEQKDAYCMTFTILETSEGVKMGKSVRGALWLDKDKTSPYEFYQYFRNIGDHLVKQYLSLLTFIDMDEINELTKYQDERINKAKERLAYEVTLLAHGKKEADLAQEMAKAAFEGAAGKMPAKKIKASLDMPVVDIMVLAEVASSKSQARRLIEGGGVIINQQKVQSIDDTLAQYADEKEFILHKGKKVRIKVVLDE